MGPQDFSTTGLLNFTPAPPTTTTTTSPPPPASNWPAESSNLQQQQPEQIVEGAENCLRHNSYLALKNVRCDYRDGVLTLRGCLPTYYLKQVAQYAVSRIQGVQRIVNAIEVVSSTRC